MSVGVRRIFKVIPKKAWPRVCTRASLEADSAARLTVTHLSPSNLLSCQLHPRIHLAIMRQQIIIELFW